MADGPPGGTPTTRPAPARCPICQSPIGAADAWQRCPACRTPYHTECWQENNGCGMYGCPQAPRLEPRNDLETPAAYWGREHKPCPVCGAEILAVALRCRHCGATFSSARPESRSDFQERVERTGKLPAWKRTAVLIFIFNALACSAPIAAVAGGIWYLSNRGQLRELPGLYRTLCLVGIGAGAVQTVFLLTMMAAYLLTQGSGSLLP